MNVIEITVKVADKASAEAEALKAELHRALNDEITVPVRVGDEALLEGDALEKLLRETLGREIVVPVRISGGEMPTSTGGDRASTGAAKVPLEPDDSGFEEKVRRKTKTEKPDPVKVPVEPEIEDFEASFRAAMDEADKVADSAARDIRGSFSAVESGSRSLRAAMADLEPAAAGAGDALDGAGAKADTGGKKASDAGANLAFLHSRVVLLSAAALALGPALAAIPAAMGAVAAGGALMTLGLGGVITALKDYGAQNAAAGQTSAQLALTAFNNAVAVRNAEQAIADARHAAAIQQQNSADQVASAQERLANAQATEQQATEALNQAWKDAVNILADVNNASADAVNSVADAQLALKQAQENATKTVSSSLTTDLQKQQALQAVTDAQQHLKDAQQHQLEAQQAADDANTKGIAGSTAVVQAQRAQAQAAQAAADAQKALVRAQQSAAEAQRQSAEQIQKAVQNLSDTYEQQKLSAAAAAASGSSAANKFAQDMAGLAPAGQAFVNQLIAMKDGAKQLAQTAQTAMLPGLTQMLKDTAPLMPVFNGAIRDMGNVVGNTATQFGKLMESPAFKGQLTTVLKDGAGLAHQLGSGFVGMVGGLTQAASNAGPILKGLGAGLQGLMVNGLPQLFEGLVNNAKGVGQAFQGILTIVSNLGGPLGTVSGALIGALAPAIQQLASPAVQQAMQAIADLIVSILQVLGPLVTLFAQGLVGALQILTPILQATAKFLADNHKWLTPLAGIILGVVAALKAWAIIQAILDGEIALSPIGLLVTAIAGLVVGLIWAWEHFKGFRDFIHQMMGDLHNWFFDVWHFIDGIWHLIAAGTDAAWQLIKSYIISPMVDGYKFIVRIFDDVKDLIKRLPGEMASIGAHMWDWISSGIGNITAVVAKGFHVFINELIQGINWAIGYVNGATHAISDAWTWIPGASDTAIPPIDKIPLWKATGGPLSNFLTHISEAGTEALRMPTGTVVIPHANTKSMIESGHASNTPATVQVEWVGGNAGDEFMTWLRKNIRIRAGSGSNSVQRALGQTF